MNMTLESIFNMNREKNMNIKIFINFRHFLGTSQYLAIIYPKQGSTLNSKERKMISASSSTNPESFIGIGDGDRKRGTDPMELPTAFRSFLNIINNSQFDHI